MLHILCPEASSRWRQVSQFGEGLLPLELSLVEIPGHSIQNQPIGSTSSAASCDMLNTLTDMLSSWTMPLKQRLQNFWTSCHGFVLT